MITRRNALKMMVCGSSIMFLGGFKVLAGELKKISSLSIPNEFTEIDHFNITHKVRDNKHFHIPKPSMKKDIVVVGGGISGLTTLYHLGDYNGLLLEKENEVGGNSRDGMAQGISFPFGAMVSQGAVPPFTQFFDQLGVQFTMIDSPEYAYHVKDKMVIDPLKEGVKDLPFDDKTKKDFRTLPSLLRPFLDPKIGIFFPKESNLREIRRLDSITLREYYDRKKINPEVRRFLDTILTSRVGDTGDNVSAWKGLYILSNFIAKNFTLKGGHGEIAEKLKYHIASRKSSLIMRNFTVVNVKNVSQNEAWVTGIDQEGKLTTIATAAVVLGIPKNFARHIISGLSQERIENFSHFKYQPFLVAQVLLKRPISPVFEVISRDHFARFIVRPDWIKENRSKEGKGHFTIYIPFSGKDGRMQLLMEPPEKWAQKINDDLRTIFRNDYDAVDEIRLYRWGHPMVLPEPSMDHVLEKSIVSEGNILFAHNDSMGIAGLYSAVWTGMSAYGETLLKFSDN